MIWGKLYILQVEDILGRRGVPRDGGNATQRALKMLQGTPERPVRTRHRRRVGAVAVHARGALCGIDRVHVLVSIPRRARRVPPTTARAARVARATVRSAHLLRALHRRLQETKFPASVGCTTAWHGCRAAQRADTHLPLATAGCDRVPAAASTNRTQSSRRICFPGLPFQLRRAALYSRLWTRSTRVGKLRVVHS